MTARKKHQVTFLTSLCKKMAVYGQEVTMKKLNIRKAKKDRKYWRSVIIQVMKGSYAQKTASSSEMTLKEMRKKDNNKKPA